MSSNALSVALFTLFVGHVLVFTTVHCFDYKVEHARVVNSKELEEFQKADSVSVVYYFKRALARMDQFMREYDKSAEYLEIYGAHTLIVDCNQNPADQTCLTPKSEFNVYTYRNGKMLLSLELTTMFDVNSIMSNVLQLVLLNEVPIVQSNAELKELTDRHKSKQNVIIGYFKGIGSFEHRVFMEIAFAYLDKYAFAVTTNKEPVANIANYDFNEADVSAMVWVLYCAEATSEKPCESSTYIGRLDLPSLAKFFRTLEYPMYELPRDEAKLPCNKEKVDCMYLFHSKSSVDKVHEVVVAMDKSSRGMVVTVLVDLDHVNVNDYSLPNAEGPFVQIKLQSKTDVYNMAEDWNVDTVLDFALSTILKDDRHQGEVVEGRTGYPVSSLSEKGDDVPDVASVAEVETQDDQVAESVYRMSISTPMTGVDLIPALTDKTFPSVEDKELLMVLFYLPFDARSMAFLRAYGEAVDKFPDRSKVPLAYVNCFDWTDVCAKQNITTYPTIRIFRKGHKVMEYKGALDTDTVVATMKLLQQPSPLVLKTEKEVEDFSKGALPENAATFSAVSVLALIPTSSKNGQLAATIATSWHCSWLQLCLDRSIVSLTGPHQKEEDLFSQAQSLADFKSVAKELQHVAVFGLVDDQMIEKAKDAVGGQVPAVMAFKHGDPLLPHEVLSGSDITTEKLTAFVEKVRIPTFVELTPLVFPMLYKQAKPLLVFFCKRSQAEDKDFATISAIASSGDFKQLFFTWMDAENAQSLGAKILAEYTKSSNVPALSVVCNKKGLVHNFPSQDLTESGVRDWLKEVLAEKVEPSKVLPKGEWKPLARPYDFLTLIDYEKTHPDFSLASLAYEGDEMAAQDEVNQALDVETRSELQDLHRSRIYRKERGLPGAHTHSHTEL